MTRTLQRRLLAGGCCLLLALAVGPGCRDRKKEDAKKPAQPASASLAARPPGVRPGIEFFEKAKQERYAAAFEDYLSQFEMPKPGSAIWFRLWNGRIVGGEITAVADDMIALRSTGAVERFALTDLSMEARARVFPAEFARQKAMAQVTGELRGPPSLSGETPLDRRFPVADHLDMRIGPDITFKRVSDASFDRGQAVSVLQEYGGWIRAALPGKTNVCWMPKYLTFRVDELNLPALRADVAELRSSGLLASVNAAENLADVEEVIWRGTDPQLRAGIARCLAAYCGAESGTRIVLVTIRDRSGNRKLGRYAQGQGWQELTPR